MARMLSGAGPSLLQDHSLQTMPLAWLPKTGVVPSLPSHLTCNVAHGKEDVVAEPAPGAHTPGQQRPALGHLLSIPSHHW